MNLSINQFIKNETPPVFVLLAAAENGRLTLFAQLTGPLPAAGEALEHHVDVDTTRT